MELDELKAKKEAPEWMSQESLNTLLGGYLLENETPREMYRRVSDSAAKYLNKPELADKFFNLMWKNWLCPASPVLSNTGTNRGFNISCFGSIPESDSVD